MKERNSKKYLKTIIGIIIEVIIVAVLIILLLYARAIRNAEVKNSKKTSSKAEKARFANVEVEHSNIKDSGVEDLSMYVEDSYTTEVHTEENPVKNIIGLYVKNGKNYLLLPKRVNLESLVIHFNEEIESVSMGELNKEEKTISGSFQNDSSFTIRYSDGKEKEIYILQSNLPSICINNIVKDDTTYSLSEVNEGIKKTKYTVDIIIEDGNAFSSNISASNTEFKGRGNYTWTLGKKGYQIKFDNKTDVFSMGASKKWVLLANHADNSLMRNKLILDLAKEMNINYTGDSTWVDVWVDGQYQGNYLFTEKVEVGKNRVDLKNDDATLVEVDNNYYKNEDFWFESKESKSHFVYKDAKEDNDDEATQQAYLEKFEEFVNNFERELYSEDKNWEEIKKYIDVDSFIKYYFIQEFAENEDAVKTSMFLYRYGTDETDKIYLGPVWDFDIAVGNFIIPEMGGNPEIDYIPNITDRSVCLDWFFELLKIPEFRKAVSDMYNDEIKNVLDTSINKINDYENQVQMSAKMNFIKWSTQGTDSFLGATIGHKNKETYAEEVEYLRDWVKRRVNYMYRRYNKNSDINMVKYISHIQGFGWEVVVSQNGEVSGSVGESRRLEAIKIYLLSFNEKLVDSYAYVKYQIAFQGEKAWSDEWKKDGQIAGATEKGKQIRAIRMKLCDGEGNDLKDCSIKYKSHIQNYGWQNWQYDGSYDSKYLDEKDANGNPIDIDQSVEAVQIVVEEKNSN